MGLLRVLLIILLVYLLLRFILRLVLPQVMRHYSERMQRDFEERMKEFGDRQNRQRPEGEVTIQAKGKRKHGDADEGEYVDFEEVK